jgi:uncharacterized protein (TIGR03437 family)
LDKVDYEREFMKYMKVRLLPIIVFICLTIAFFPWRHEKAQTIQDPGLRPFEQLLQITGRTETASNQSTEATGSGIHQNGSDALTDSFMITRTENGIACRQMTVREVSEMRVNARKTGLRIINDDGHARLQAQGMKIVLQSTSQLDGFPQAKEAFLRAAARWEAIIQSQITIVIDVDYGPTRFGVPYPSPNVIGSTGTQSLFSPQIYSAFRERLITGADNAQQSAIFNALPQNAILTDSGSTQGVFAPSPVFRALGFLNPAADPDSERPTLGNPPSIGFNSSIDFDFDPSNGIDFDKIDFTAAAIHEIGHALGFFSLVGTRERVSTVPVALTAWDFFRFRPGVNLDSFTTAQRLLLSGDVHTHFAGGNELLLSTGRDDGIGGDGRQASHWKDDVITGQYLGIMDPTGRTGELEEVTASDLLTLGHFGYSVRSDVTVSEIISIDRGIRGAQPVVAGALLVNRLTPSRYPATVKGIRVNIPVISSQPDPAGAQLRVIVFSDPAATGQPPNNPQLLFDQNFTIPEITSSRFVEFTFNGPVINSGDLYLGVQTIGTVPIAIDVCPPGPFANLCATFGQPLANKTSEVQQLQLQRSFVSQNNGASFQPLQTLTGAANEVTFMARAIVSVPFGVNPVPSLFVASPNAVPPGGQGFSLYVKGDNFQPNSVVRWNGNDRPTTLMTGSQLQAMIPAGDIASAGTASVTVFTPGPGGGSSNPLNVNITTDNPLPVLTRLSPETVAVGSPSLTLNVFGSAFTPNSVIRIDNNDRPTTFIGSTQLSTMLQASDLATDINRIVRVITPGPGGGTSTPSVLSVVPCNYSLSSANKSYFSAGTTDGVTLTTNSPCAWTATADVPWITFLNPAGGAGNGKYVINYQVGANTAPTPRMGTITIGGQQIMVRQAGLIASVSAANFLVPLAPESIVATFGAGLANATEVATSTPLPTTLAGASVRVTDSTGAGRTASLFFASASQINFQMPPGTAAGNATVAVILDGLTQASGSVAIVPVSPGLFSANSSGKDVAGAVILRVSGGVQTYEPVAMFDQAQNRAVPKPIDLGPETDQVFLILFGTGIRRRTSLTNVSLKIGNVDVTPQFAGAQPDYVGLDQVNCLLPRSLKGQGEVTINLSVDGRAANVVTIAVQ